MTKIEPRALSRSRTRLGAALSGLIAAGVLSSAACHSGPPPQPPAPPPALTDSESSALHWVDAHAAELMEDAAALYDDAGFVHEAVTARRDLQKTRDGASTPNAPNAPLTQREMEVLRLVANGLSEREVADKLFISPHTAHRHLSNIRLKLNVATQAAAVAHAARIGLI